jgi:LCP family protein required for cell wall assembly
VGSAFVLGGLFDNQIKVVDAFPDERYRPAPSEGDALNILLLGSDTRGAVGTSLDDIRGQRSDTMMLVHVPDDRSEVRVMSIMRDTWVEIPGHSPAKINAAMSYGGVPLVVQTLEGMFDVRIDHVAVIDFEGFGGLTEVLGGVTVNNPKAFTSSRGGGTRFEKGPIRLSGDEALIYVRERYAFTFGDYQRVRNQQAFMKGLMSEVLKPEIVANPLAVGSAITTMAPYLLVDSELTSTYMAGLAFQLRDLRARDVSMFTLPTLGTGNIGGQSVVILDEVELGKISDALKSGTFLAYTPPPTGR